MNELFFELIRVAIGTQESLSRMPSEFEWKALYDMAKKQSLVGICFAGIQGLGADVDEGFAKVGLPEMLYLKWMGMAAKIQQKNQMVDEQCAELGERLKVNGYRYSILKGQGVGQLYAEHLRGLRQSGDIDVYVDCGMEMALKYARDLFGNVEYDYINAHVPFFKGTEVELHWKVGYMSNLFMNRKLHQWVKAHENELFAGSAKLKSGNVTVPSSEFNAFYILLHAYNHVQSEGLGLRQLMDYYFVLRARNNTNPNANINLVALFKQFGMSKFASGVMWIMKDVFGLPKQLLICEANEKEGMFLLNEVMMSGNFGHHDERIKKIGKGKMVSVMNEIQHSLIIASHYPSIVFWRPIWIVYHFLWKRLKRI